ncbi:MAG: HAMP domain-containing histidine kinase [Proteobacteria bacterium]|nr:HAMP domain-containing histidine kinase [Pseudomonadota bacterium]
MVITFLGIILLTGTLGYLAASRSSYLLHESVEKQGRILARTVAALIINERIYEKLGLVEEGGLIDNYVRDLYGRRDLDFLYVAVLDENNRIISHNDFSHYGETLDNAFIREVVRTDEVVINRAGSQEDGHQILEFAAPLSIGTKRWGALIFAVSLAEIEHESRRMLGQIAGVLAIALIVGLGLIVLLNRKFISPITTMARTMQEMDSELPECRVEVSGNNELAMLGRSFNSMIDRIRESNLAMKQAHEKLLQSEKLATLGILSSSVAHRINNPLGGLQNCIAMLKRQGGDAEFRRSYLDLMQEGVDSIKQTIDQLLWSAGKRRGEESRANIADILASVMRFVDYRIKKSEINYHAEVPGNLFVPVPPHDLNQILVNLLINAIQAMPAGGELKVSAIVIETGTAITISDTGTGIDAAEIDKIFDLYYTSKKPSEGTGLGLWMTYELIQKNKGDISVDSRIGHGTTFTVCFPVHLEKKDETQYSDH